MSPRLVLAASLAAILAIGSVAAADGTALDKASAEALFQDAMKEMADKHYALACPKLEESQRLDPAVGTQFRLAECYEAVGRSASAWASYLEVADLARNAGQADRERVAHERAQRLVSKLSRLTVTVSAPEMPGLEVRRGGLPLGRAQWGASLPVDPATYEVTATAPGKAPWSGSVNVGADGALATLTVPKLGAIAMTMATPTPSLPSSSPGAEPASTSRPWVTVGLASGAVGLASVGVGAVFAVLAHSGKTDYEKSCGASIGAPSPNLCNATGVSGESSAALKGTLSTVFFVGGGVIAAAGATVFVVGWREERTTRVGIGPRGVTIEGRF
jgi:hypothetical protein